VTRILTSLLLICLGVTAAFGQTVPCQMTAAALNPEDPPFNALGNGTADDTISFMTAQRVAVARNLPLKLTRIYRISSSQTIAATLCFTSGAALAPDATATLTLAAQPRAPSDAWIFRGNGTIIVQNASDVWTSWWGALANASTDSAPAFRAAIGSNRTIHTYPASYVFSSTIATTGYGPFPAAVYPIGQSKFTFDNWFSTFKASAAVNATVNALFFLDRNTDGGIEGGTYIGDVTRLSNPAVQESVAIVTHNQVNPRIRNIVIAGNWGGLSTGFAGDYVVNGVYEHIRAMNTGQCEDIAFVKDTIFDDWNCSGSDATGSGGSLHSGSKGFAFLYDPPAAGDNYLPRPYDTLNTNSGVKLLHSTVTNYNSCIQVAAGDGFLIEGNNIYGCPGNSNGAQGIGLEITYDAIASVGHPVTDLIAQYNWIHDNGSQGAGAGVNLGNGSITNRDVMAGIQVVNNIIENNNVCGINATGMSHLRNIDVRTGNLFIPGANQKFALSGHL
jgi:hypothetical protein